MGSGSCNVSTTKWDGPTRNDGATTDAYGSTKTSSASDDDGTASGVCRGLPTGRLRIQVMICITLWCTATEIWMIELQNAHSSICSDCTAIDDAKASIFSQQ